MNGDELDRFLWQNLCYVLYCVSNSLADVFKAVWGHFMFGKLSSFVDYT